MQVAQIEDKMNRGSLRWFNYVQCQTPDALVHTCEPWWMEVF